MSGQADSTHLAEWAALVDESVPDSAGCERPHDREER